MHLSIVRSVRPWSEISRRIDAVTAIHHLYEIKSVATGTMLRAPVQSRSASANAGAPEVVTGVQCRDKDCNKTGNSP